MRWWPFILLTAGLAGCVHDRDPDPYDGPYVYDGGYYDAPRQFDYDVEQRDLYGRSYYYPPAYPYFYGGYGRGYRYYDHRDHGDGRHDDNDGRDRDRDRDRGDRSPSPADHAVPDRPAKANVGRSDDGGGRPSAGGGRSSGGGSSGGPHGRH